MPKKVSEMCLKTSTKEKKNIDFVLSFLQLHEDDLQQKEGDKEQEELPAEVGSSLPSPSKVFNKVLSRTASDPASPTYAAKDNNQLVPCSSPCPLERKGSSKSAFLEDLDLNADEKEELKFWMQQNCSDLKRKRKKGKAKGLKKPAAASAAVSPKVKKTKAKKANVVKKKQSSHKTTFLHRATSTAWHKGKHAALKAGKSQEEAKEAGREAADKVRQEIRDGLLKEE